MDIKKIQMLNEIYRPLQEYTMQIIKELKLQGFKYEWGYYGGHSIKHDDDWILEKFPIPIITIKDICEIGVDLNHIFIEGKLKRESAMSFDFSILKEYKFEVYGIEDYLNDFYNKNLNLNDIQSRITESDEQEIGISLFFEKEETIEILLEVVHRLDKLGFHVL